MAENSIQHFDVIISGGGLSGLLTAIGLKQESPQLTVAVIEPVAQTEKEAIKSNFDQRCLALSHGTLQLLEHWQVLRELDSLVWPIQTIVTSDRGHIGKTVMRATDYHVDAMGKVVSMHNLGVALQAVASKHDIYWYCPDSIAELDDAMRSGAEKVTVTLESGEIVSATLLVVAEGGQSPTRALFNIDAQTHHYEQAAVIANVKVGKTPKSLELIATGSEPTKHVAFERFTTSGPIAFLPIGDNEYNVVWTQAPEAAQRTETLDDAAFLAELQQAFGFSAGNLIACSKRARYPLALTKVERLTSHRAVLLGNSAHTVHPIAGQGFNLGVRDIGVLVFSIAQEMNKVSDSSVIDIGAFQVLQGYEQNRQDDIRRIVDFTDSLVRIFALPGRLPAFARTSGLMTLQSCDSLQQWLALHFMGSHKQYNLNQYRRIK